MILMKHAGVCRLTPALMGQSYKALMVAFDATSKARHTYTDFWSSAICRQIVGNYPSAGRRLTDFLDVHKNCVGGETHNDYIELPTEKVVV